MTTTSLDADGNIEIVDLSLFLEEIGSVKIGNISFLNDYLWMSCKTLKNTEEFLSLFNFVNTSERHGIRCSRESALKNK